MKEEFNLSERKVNVMEIDEKLWTEPYGSTKMLEENPFSKNFFYPDENVKEFIRLLKKDTGCIPINSREIQIRTLFRERIDKLAGPKLSEAGK